MRYGENLKVGHSYFMEEDLDVDLLSRIWASDVLPYLEEQLFGRGGRYPGDVLA